MNKIVFATNNKHKLSEIRDLVFQHIKILSLSEINCFEEILETHNTFKGNALQKAEYIFTSYGYDCFADDSGLEISFLGGEPGVYSARYAGNGCLSEDNIRKVLDKLGNSKNRNAKFKTVIALIINNQQIFFEGECKGEITHEIRGSGGFGYDPIFIPEGHDITFAEMTKSQKGEISHRGQAVKKLIDFLSK